MDDQSQNPMPAPQDPTAAPAPVDPAAPAPADPVAPAPVDPVAPAEPATSMPPSDGNGTAAPQDPAMPGSETTPPADAGPAM